MSYIKRLLDDILTALDEEDLNEIELAERFSIPLEWAKSAIKIHDGNL